MAQFLHQPTVQSAVSSGPQTTREPEARRDLVGSQWGWPSADGAAGGLPDQQFRLSAEDPLSERRHPPLHLLPAIHQQDERLRGADIGTTVIAITSGHTLAEQKPALKPVVVPVECQKWWKWKQWLGLLKARIGSC